MAPRIFAVRQDGGGAHIAYMQVDTTKTDGKKAGGLLQISAG